MQGDTNSRIVVKIPERPDRKKGDKSVQKQDNPISKQENSVLENNQDRGKVVIKLPEHPRRSRMQEQRSEITTNIHSNNIEKSFEELALLAKSVVMIGIHDKDGKIVGTGSGIMIGRSGYILTNEHVIRDGAFHSVRIEGEDKAYPVESIVKYHALFDLAVIRIEKQLEPLPVYKGEAPLVRGQKLVAIGSPLGFFNSVSDGIVAGFRKIDEVSMLQFTAPVSPGSSGGAVLNMRGEVIGISTMVFSEGQNINMAVTYETINPFVRGFIT